MRFHYYGDPYSLGYYGAPVAGYHGEAPQFPGYAGYGYYGAPDLSGYGYYGTAEPGYGEPEPVGYYADEAPVGYYGEDPNAFAEYEPVAGCGYGEMPEMVGYGEDYGEAEPFAEEYPGVSDYAEDISGYDDYGEPGIEGYVREVPAPFNAGCPMPTNTGLAEAETFAGYTRPGEVSPACTGFTEQPGSPSNVPDTLRPLW
jgi:hypothetical protein